MEKAKEPQMETSPIKTLVIEDDHMILSVIKGSLGAAAMARFDLNHAGTLAEARGLLIDKKFDIIILDLMLPDSDPSETFLKIHSHAPELPIVILTSNDDEHLAVKSMKDGAQDYVVKGAVDIKFLPRILYYAIVRKRVETELKKSKEELELQAWGLKKTNEGVKALYKELEKKNEQLRHLDQLKSQFVANVSHEFRNPLTVIRESLSIVSDGIVGALNPKQTSLLKSAQHSIERLIRLVTDLLDIAKIESGKVELRREQFDVALLLEEILDTYEKEIAKKELTLKKDIQKDVGMIWADRDKICQVMINLLNNAIKYTPSGKSIYVKLTGDPGEIRFEVTDTGQGMKKEDLEKIFDKFERVTTEKQEGTGLGLPIAKDIVGLHKGKISVESELGKGSSFVVLLPRDAKK